jgi:SAM-dependent methyltransferase
LDVKCEVERLENVIGSGITHLRYFPPAVSFLKRKVVFDIMVDIGCGDGQFLSTFLKSVPVKKAIGIDLSRLSTETTCKNLKEQYPDLDVTTICCDALDVEKWSRKVVDIISNKRIAISMWFLLHEISQNKPNILVDFFQKIHKVFPDASIVVGEVVRQSEKILLKQNERSLMSEYLFFHEMSGQGILLWEEYREVLKKIPYELALEKLFDEALDNEGTKIPSTFVWCLMPKQKN